MLRLRRWLGIGLALLLVASLLSPVLANDDEALAVVNGAAILPDAFLAEYARIATFSMAADPGALALDVLHGMIDDELVRQFAAGQGLGPAEAAVEAQVARARAKHSPWRWRLWLARNLYTAADFRAALGGHLTRLAVRDHVTAYLHEPVLHTRARHILVARRHEAERARTRLAAGADFGMLAAELSLDRSTRGFGGDLGWFIRGELLTPGLEQQAFTRAPGAVSEPIASRLGYHLLQVLEREPRLIESQRLPYLVERSFERWLEAQWQSAEISINRPALDALMAALR